MAVVLVLANVGYFAWNRGAFAAFGLQPSRFTESEPHRMARQVRPDMLQVLKEPPPRPAPFNQPPTEPPAKPVMPEVPEVPADVHPPATPPPASP